MGFLYNYNYMMTSLVKSALSAANSLLNDDKCEVPTACSDRMAATQSMTANVQLQEAVQPVEAGFGVTPADVFQANRLSGSLTVANPFKLFRIRSITWTTSNGEGHVFSDAAKIQLPKSFTTEATSPAYGLASYFGLIRTGFEITVSINPNQGHSGLLAVIYVPAQEVSHVEKNLARFWRNHCKYPHAFLDCNGAKSCTLKIPHVATTEYVATHESELGQIYFMVISPLHAATGTNTEISVTAFAALSGCTFSEPLAHGVGPNLGAVCTAGNTDVLNACMGRVGIGVNHAAVGYPPVNDGLEAYRLPFLLHRATIPTSSAAGDTVYQANIDLSAVEGLQGIFRTYQLRHGSMYFRFVDVSAKLNAGTLAAVWQWNDAKNYSWDNTKNMYQTTWQLGLNDTHDFNIPYVKESYTTRDGLCGRLEIFVTQGVTHTSASPTSISLLVYIGICDDMIVHGPHGERPLTYGWGSDMDEADEAEGQQGEGVDASKLTSTDVSSGAAVDTGLACMANEGGDPSAPKVVTHAAALQCTKNPVTVSQSKIGIMEQKMFYVGFATVEGSKTNTRNMAWPTYGPLAMLQAYTYFRCTGVKFIIYCGDGEHSFMASHSWFSGGAATEAAITAHSSAIGARSCSFHSPWHYEFSVKGVAWLDALGSLAIRNLGTGEAKYTIWCSFTGLEVFFPRMAPYVATLYDVATQPRLHHCLEMFNPTDDWDTPVPEKEPEPEEYPLLSKFLTERGEDVDTFIDTHMRQKQKRHKRTPRDRTTRVEEMIAAENEDELFDMFKQLELRFKHKRHRKRDPASMSTWERDLTKDGDVESNPGPVCHLVYRDRGIYKHYGVLYEGVVYHTDTLPGETDLRNVVVKADPQSEDWTFEEAFDIDVAACQRLVETQGLPFNFSIHNTCEEYARGMTGSKKRTQIYKFKAFACIAIAATSAAALAQPFSMANPTPFSPFAIFSANLFEGIIDKVMSETGKMLIKLFVRCFAYVGLFVSSPKTSTAVLIAALIGTDVTSTGPAASKMARLYKLLMSGEVHQIVDCLHELSHEGIDEPIIPEDDIMKPEVLYAKMLNDPAYAHLPMSGRIALATEKLAHLVRRVYPRPSPDTTGEFTSALQEEVAKYDVIPPRRYRKRYESIGSDDRVFEDEVDVTGGIIPPNNTPETKFTPSAALFMEMNSPSVAHLTPSQKLLQGMENLNRKIQEMEDSPTPHGPMDYLKDFNVTTHAAKGVEWWLNLLKNLFHRLKRYFMPDAAEKAGIWLDSNFTKVEQTIDAALMYLYDVTNKDCYQQRKMDYTRLCDNLKFLYKTTILAGSTRLASDIKMLLLRMANAKPVRSVEDPMRFDPLGVYIYGEPGVGKSFVVNYLINHISQGVSLEPTTYPHPIGSDHMDGYNGQTFHVFDDFGQCADEKEYMHVINACSSVPFIVPQAHLDNKGTPYESKFVFCTSNLSGFDGTTTLRDIKALERRFLHRLVVKPKDKYCDARGRLDVGKAGADGAIKNGNAWDIGYTTHHDDMKKMRDVRYWTSLGAVADKICTDYGLRMATYLTTKMNTPNMVEKWELLSYGPDDKPQLCIMSFGALAVSTKLEIFMQHRFDTYKSRNATKADKAVVVIGTNGSDFHSQGGDKVEIAFRVGLGQAMKDDKVMEMFPKCKLIVDLPDSVVTWAETFNKALLAMDVPSLHYSVELSMDTFFQMEAIEPVMPTLSNTASKIPHDAQTAIDEIEEFERKRTSEEGSEADLDISIASYLNEMDLKNLDDVWYYGTGKNGEEFVECLALPKKRKPWKTRLVEILKGLKSLIFSRTMLSIFAGLTGVISIAMGIWTAVEYSRAMTQETEDVKEEKGRAYNPVMTVKGKKILPTPHGPEEHLTKYLIRIQVNGNWIHGCALGGHAILTYHHGVRDNEVRQTKLEYNGHEYVCEMDTVYPITDDSGNGCDLAIITLAGLPIFLKSSLNHFAVSPGTHGVVMWRTGKNATHTQQTGPTHLRGPMIYDDKTVCASTIEVPIHSVKGSCGGMLVQTINGATKFTGLLTAGYSLRQLSIFADASQVPKVVEECAETRGIVVDKTPSYTAFVPSKTRLQLSPLAGLEQEWPRTQEPAVLHSKDPRLEVDIENMVKHCSDKWHNDVWNVDEDLMDEVVFELGARFKATLGQHGTCGLAEALNGTGDDNAIDLTTSAGLFYPGKRKGDLIYKINDILLPTTRLDKDVNELLAEYRSESIKPVPPPIFGTYLKDELRKLPKIATGKTRVIECCDLRLTCAYRCIAGRIYNKIYTVPSDLTGIAVGMNPYTDFHPLWHTMKQIEETKPDYVPVAIDYTAFDSTLTLPLMSRAVEALSYCSSCPATFKAVHRDILISTHQVWDEEWLIKGGMPSGAPCTSVINSICNLIMCQYIHKMLTREYGFFCAYGDDNVGVADSRFAQNFVELAETCFGVKATSADKASDNIRTTWKDMSFLKRTFIVGPTGRVTGALDVDTIIQHLQWCRGEADFSQQIDSLSTELAAAGETTYTAVWTQADKLLLGTKFLFPPYKIARNRWALLVG